MFQVFFDADAEVFVVQAQAYCGEWLTFGQFADEAPAVALRNRLDAGSMGEPANLDSLTLFRG